MPVALREREITSLENVPQRAAIPESPPQNALRLVLAMRRRLDHVSLTSLLCDMPGVDLVASEADLTIAMEACRSLEPDAAIFDINFPNAAAPRIGDWLIRDGYVKRIAFLDDRLAILRAREALSIQGAIYFTRDEDLLAVCSELRRPVAKRGNGPPPGARPNLLTSMDMLKRFDHQGLTGLTAKERLVLRYLAGGYPVKEIAKMLNLAHSTVDNHKSRIMKKLNLHRSTLLTRIAIEAGLVD